MLAQSSTRRIYTRDAYAPLRDAHAEPAKNTQGRLPPRGIVIFVTSRSLVRAFIRKPGPPTPPEMPQLK